VFGVMAGASRIIWSGYGHLLPCAGTCFEAGLRRGDGQVHRLMRMRLGGWTDGVYYGLMGNKCLACGKQAPYYFINHAIKYSNINSITILVTCHVRRNYR